MRKIILFIASIIICLSAMAQEEVNINYIKANKLYNIGFYAKAIPHFEKVLNEGTWTEVEDAEVKIAHCYNELRNYSKAAEAYKRIVTDPATEPINYYNYAHVLKSMGQYDEAKKWFTKYAKFDEVGNHFANTCDFAKSISTVEQTVRLRSVDFNSPQSDITAVQMNDKILFASSRPAYNENLTNLYPQSGQPFYDIFQVKLKNGTEDEYGLPRLLSGAVNTRYHEATIAKAGEDKLFFTRNNYYKGSSEKSQNGLIKLEIFEATFKNTGWKDITPFMYNNKDYSLGHPSLSSNGQVMYLVADLPGGQGGTDLYVCERRGDAWTKPMNMGANINTPGNEMFPYIQNDILYFSSDYHPGLGGLDIFYVHKVNDEWQKVINAGLPYNSPRDDFGISFNEDGSYGYFSSNRKGGKGDDDIYRFDIIGDKLRVRILDATTNLPLQGADITVGKCLAKPVTMQANENGYIYFNTELDNSCQLNVKLKGYETNFSLLDPEAGNPLKIVYLNKIVAQIPIEEKVVKKEKKVVEKEIPIIDEPKKYDASDRNELDENFEVQVTDDLGLPMVGARVYIRKCVEEERIVMTNNSGHIIFKPNLKFNCSLEISKEGYKTKKENYRSKRENIYRTVALEKVEIVQPKEVPVVRQETSSVNSYKIQLGVYKNPNVDFDYLSDLGTVSKIKKNGLNIYLLGDFYTASKANKALKEVVKRGIADALIYDPL